LLRAYAAQVEALRRLRNGGSQTFRVEHVYVNEGGQAIIGKSRRGRRLQGGARDQLGARPGTFDAFRLASKPRMQTRSLLLS
jgi:hypothetical protein